MRSIIPSKPGTNSATSSLTFSPSLNNLNKLLDTHTKAAMFRDPVTKSTLARTYLTTRLDLGVLWAKQVLRLKFEHTFLLKIVCLL